MFLYSRLEVPKDVVRGTSAVTSVLQASGLEAGLMWPLRPAAAPSAGALLLSPGAWNLSV